MSSVREILSEHPDGIGLDELLRVVRERLYPDLTPGQLESEIVLLGEDAETDGSIVRLRQTNDAVHAAPSPDAVGDGHPLRLVGIDLETVLRYTEAKPEGERTIFQTGQLGR